MLDAMVIGAGVSGIHQLHRLREVGLAVECVEAGAAIGGTWYWNRYPGARVDSESYTYAYFFSDELYAEWDWSEHFCDQEENERYLNHVVDRFGLRPSIRLGVRVLAARFDPKADVWDVELSDGTVRRTRFLITAIGILSEPQYPRAPGREEFTGEGHHTARWPAEGVDLAGKKVAVIGTGSSGVQIITAIAGVVGELTVFQRTPNWCPPLNNDPLPPDELAGIKDRHREIWATCRQNMGGSISSPPAGSALDLTPARRREFYEELLACGRGLAPLFANYLEVLTDTGINREFADLLAERVRARVHDPVVAEKLIPTDHLFGVKRPPLEAGYYEVFNQPNVTLVDLRETPLLRFTPRGLRTTAGDHEFDVAVYATGFDAVTGAFDRIDFHGTGPGDLRQLWSAGPLTHAGLASPGFPNLLFAGGPQSLSGATIPRVVEHQVELITDLLRTARERGCTRVECTEQSARDWTKHVHEVVEGTIFATGDSWMFGSNVPGKPRAFGLYPAGVKVYADQLDAIRAHDFAGFMLS